MQLNKWPNKYINDRAQKSLWAGPSLLRSSDHSVGVRRLKILNKLGVCFLVVLVSGCSSTPSGEVYGLDNKYYGASEYCLNLKKEAYKDVSDFEVNDRYTSECEAYSGSAPPMRDQHEDCVINVLLGGSCSEAYDKWKK